MESSLLLACSVLRWLFEESLGRRLVRELCPEIPAPVWQAQQVTLNEEVTPGGYSKKNIYIQVEGSVILTVFLQNSGAVTKKQGIKNQPISLNTFFFIKHSSTIN